MRTLSMTTNLLSGTKARIRQGQQGQHLICARHEEPHRPQKWVTLEVAVALNVTKWVNAKYFECLKMIEMDSPLWIILNLWACAQPRKNTNYNHLLAVIETIQHRWVHYPIWLPQLKYFQIGVLLFTKIPSMLWMVLGYPMNLSCIFFCLPCH